MEREARSRHGHEADEDDRHLGQGPHPRRVPERRAATEQLLGLRRLLVAVCRVVPESATDGSGIFMCTLGIAGLQVVSQSNSFAHWFGSSFSVENKRVEIMQLIERLSGERWTNVKHLVEQVVDEVKRETEVERQRMPGQQQMVLVQTGRDGKAFVYACSPNEVYATGTLC